jgi:predicted HicB family RNase H-like nuclease
MSYSKNKTEYNIQYAKENLKRIPLDVQKSKYEKIQAAAQKANESVNGYIKKAIDMRMDNSQPAE